MRPEQANVNSSRGNNYYDKSDPGASGYKAYTNTAAGLVWSRTAITWEPPDMVKGDVARALLYMAIRYTGDAINEPQLTLTTGPGGFVARHSIRLPARWLRALFCRQLCDGFAVGAWRSRRRGFSVCASLFQFLIAVCSQTGRSTLAFQTRDLVQTGRMLEWLASCR